MDCSRKIFIHYSLTFLKMSNKKDFRFLLDMNQDIKALINNLIIMPHRIRFSKTSNSHNRNLQEAEEEAIVSLVLLTKKSIQKQSKN